MSKKYLNIFLIFVILLSNQFAVASAKQKNLIQAVAVSKSILLEPSKFTCAIRNFELWCWGSEKNHGHLGIDNGDNTYYYGAEDPSYFLDVQNPINISDRGVLAGKQVTDLDLGREHGCVVADSAAYCWGRGHLGLLGIAGLEAYENNAFGFTSPFPVPVYSDGVLKGKKVTSIAVGTGHACAVADGNAYCWGFLGSGALGIDLQVEEDYVYGYSLPVEVGVDGLLKGKKVTDISAGESTTCAVADGAVYCWGGVEENIAQLGLDKENYFFGEDGKINPRGTYVPLAVSTNGSLKGKQVTDVSVGGNHVCAIADRRVYCWGLNENSALGLGLDGCFQSIKTVKKRNECLYPPSSPRLEKNQLLQKNISFVDASGDDTTCVVASSQLFCWGMSALGSLGTGKQFDTFHKPTNVSAKNVLGQHQLLSVSLESHGCAATVTDIFCWGPAIQGDGVSRGSFLPKKVDFVSPTELRIIKCLKPKSSESEFLSRVIGKNPKCDKGLIQTQKKPFK